MSNKVKLSHKKKKTMARNMMSTIEKRYGVSPFSSYAWKHRAKIRQQKAKAK